MTTNREIADLLDEYGRILELKEANIFKIRAFQSAARTVQSLSQNIEQIYLENGIEGLQNIDGIGKSISKSIKEYIDNGKIEGLDKLKSEIPEGLIEMVAIEGLGPKSINKLHKELGVSNIDDLEKAAKAGKIRSLSGFGEKTEDNIIEGIDLYKRSNARLLRMEVIGEANYFVKKLQIEFDKISRIEIAGSMRRKQPTIGDVDILIQAPKEITTNIMDYIVSIPEVSRTLVSGNRKTSILSKSDLQIDFRVIEDPSEYAAHLQYFTGSKEHNIKIRQIAISKNLSLNEYGLKQENGEYLQLETEEAIYQYLGLQFVPPELREDRGEIDLAKSNNLPTLVESSLVKADFHVHSLWSEGNNSVKEMANAALDRGLSYVVFTDHTQDLVIANGMDEEKVIQQIQQINDINDQIDGIELFTGAELNIRDNGEVDLDENTLNMLDFAIASIHSGFKQSADQITERITTAMEYDKVKVFAHPTGRQVNKRDPYDLHIDKIVECAISNNVSLEINGSQRQDLDDIILHSLRDKEVTFSLGSDAHSVDQLINLDYAIDLARRGWVHPNRIINTYDLDKFRSRFLK